MTKKELIAALANVNDDAVVLFGTKEIQFFGAFATQVYINWACATKKNMTKKELIAALANVNDDAVVLFGTKEIQFFGAFATQVYINWDSNEVLIANKHTDATTPVYCELLHEDKTH